MSSGIHDILSEIKSLEAFPHVAMRVVEIAGHEDVVPRDLVAVIQTDPGVTAKVLKLCNSAYYGFAREIASLAEATNLLGVSTLVNLVITSCAGRYFRNYGALQGRSAEALWERSVMNALAASLVAKIGGHVDKNRAYTAGLLQNVGHLVLARFLQEDAAKIRAAQEQGASLLEAERTVLGLHHAEIGARLAQKWNLPEALVDTIRHHHTPEHATFDRSLTAAAHIGEVLTTAFTDGEALASDPYGLDERALVVSGLDKSLFDTMEETLMSELRRARAFLAAA